MNTAEEIKTLVREKYGQIAEQSREENAASCCGAGGCSTVDYTIMSEDYSATDGYVPDADLGLGCGIPTEFAQIKKGDAVLDLGSNSFHLAVARVVGNGLHVVDRVQERVQLAAGLDGDKGLVASAQHAADAFGEMGAAGRGTQRDLEATLRDVSEAAEAIRQLKREKK